MRANKILPLNSGKILETNNLEKEELICELIEDEDVYGESLPELGNQKHYVVTVHGVRRRVRINSLDTTPILLGEQQHRLSTSMNAVNFFLLICLKKLLFFFKSFIKIFYRYLALKVQNHQNLVRKNLIMVHY